MLRAIRALREGRVFLYMLVVMSAGTAMGQTTAFTYQGQLKDGGAVANGVYDLRFAIFDSAMGGVQIGTPQTVPTVLVSGGVFTVPLDFGVSAFPGADRFLEIGVKPAEPALTVDGSVEGGSFTTLAPRQQVTSTPYAIQALNAQQLGGLLAARYVQSNASGNVGIGTASPTAKLTVSGTGAYNAPDAARFDLFNTTAGTGYVQHVTDGGLWQLATTAGATRMAVDSSGNIGIGTTSPGSKFAVQTASSSYGFTHTDGLVTLGSYIGLGSGQIGTRSNHPLSFFTNDSAPRMTIDRFGNVGIGTLGGTSDVRVFVDGGPPWTSAGWLGSLAFTNVSAIGWSPNASGQQFGIGQTNGGLYFFRTTSSFGQTSGSITYDMTIADSGNIGIGTTSPVSGRLQVDGGSANSGVYATTGATNVPGMYGGSSGLNGTGVIGEANNGPTAYGVWGKSTSGYGVFGQSSLYGVYGKSPGADAKGSGFAVYAEGDLKVTGSALVAGNVYAFGDVFANDFHTTSDRNLKANFSNVEPRAILRSLVSIPIQTWNFQSQPEAVRHLGPMAQDFHAAFDLGEDDKHISTLDANGVALAAIQGLYQIVQEKNRQLQDLQVRVRQLERRVPHKRAGGGS